MIPRVWVGGEGIARSPASYRGAWIFSRASRFILLCCCLLPGCGSNDPDSPGLGDIPLTLLASYSLDVREPSGLAVDGAGASLWVVGNRAQRIYRLSLDGEVQDRLDFKGDNLEGIACDPADATLWVVEEQHREVVHLDAKGEVLARHKLDLEGKPNSGLEGICLDSSGTVYVVNEKNPGLFVTLNADLSIASQRQLDFAEDLSGLDCGDGRFWVLSDQSRMLYRWSPDGGVTGAYPLPFDKAEGVAVDLAAGLVYIVSESEDRLYVYAIEDPE